MTFKDEVIALIESTTDKLTSANPLMGAIMPIVKLGKRAILHQLEKDPKEVYGWIVTGKAEAERLMQLYEDENKPKP